MAGCFTIGELPQELRIVGHDDVPDPVIMSCLSQMQLTDHCYEKSTSLVGSRAANDRSSPHSCVRAGKSPRHEHGPPVPGDRDFRQEADSIFPNCTLATELHGLKKMLRVMGEAKEELLGSLTGPGSFKRRSAHADEEEDVGKLFSEWRLVGRTLRPIDNNVVAGDQGSFKASPLAQNLKGENQFFEPLVYQTDENAKGDHQFYEPLVAYSTIDPSELTKPSQGAAAGAAAAGDSFKSTSLNTTNTRKNHGFEPQGVATVFNELSDSAKSAGVGDFGKPGSAVSHRNKENPTTTTEFDPDPAFHATNELSESTKSVSRKGICQQLDSCHVLVDDASLSDGEVVTSPTMCQDRKESRKLVDERDTVLRFKRGSDHPEEEEDTTSFETVTSTGSTLTTETEDSASNLKGSVDRMKNKNKSPEFLREEKILEAAIEAGVSYFHDGVVYRENLIYDMLRSPSSGTQEDILDSNHDLEEFQKPAPRKKSYNPELFSLSNDHFLEAFERTLAELDPKDTIDQETFASVTRHSAEPEPVFHQFNFASLVDFRIEDENLLDPNSPPLVSPVLTTAATPDREFAGPLANLDDPSPLLTDDAKEMNQFLLDEETSRDGPDEVNQFFLEGESLRNSAEEVKHLLLEEKPLTKDPFNVTLCGPTTPDQGAEVNPPPRKEQKDRTARNLADAFNRAQTVRMSSTVVNVASAIQSPDVPAARGVEEISGHLAPSELSAAAPSKAQGGPALLIVPMDELQGTASTYQEGLMQRCASVQDSDRVVRSSAADNHPYRNHRSTLSLPNFSSEEMNGSRVAGELDRGTSGHLEPLNDRSNIPTENAEELNQRSRPRPKTITDFFNPSEMTLRRPSTIEPRKKEKADTKSSLRTPDQRSPTNIPVDLRFALPPPSARSSRRHSLSEKSLEIAGLALTPIKVPSRDRVCAVHGLWDQSQSSCSLCSHGAPKRRGESRVFGAAGNKSPQLEITPHRKPGESASPFGVAGVAGSQSPYGKIHTSYLKKGGGSSSPSGSTPGSKTPQSTTSSGSEASPKQNSFKRSTSIYSSLVPREKRSGDGSSVLFNTSRLSTSVNLPSSSRMSTSVNLPSSSERLGNQRQSTSRSSTESLHSSGSQRRSPAQDIKNTADSTHSKPSFSTSTTLVKSRTISSTTTREKLTPGAARRTQSVKDRVTR